MRTWLVMGFGLAAGCAGGPPQSESVPNGTVIGERAAKMDARLAEGFSGVAVAALDGKVVLAKGYGFADRERKNPFTIDTVYDVGSITKQFTAAAIVKLEEQGRLGVSDTIDKYFAGVPADKKAVTLHHLLTHAAGFGSRTASGATMTGSAATSS